MMVSKSLYCTLWMLSFFGQCLSEDLQFSDTSTGVLKGETSLEVFENITNVRLVGPEEPLIEGESSANITTEGTGTITSVQWMKDNSPLSPSNSIIFSSDNRSVSIILVQRSDSGEYQCTYSNPVSSETAKLNLIVNYGPDDVSITGPNVVDLGVRVSLSCSANSEPSPSFSWRFNGSDTGVTTVTFTIYQTDFTNSGDYECTAWNNVTERSATQKHALLVQGGGGGGGGGLTAGPIAGIVIGVLAAVAGICGLIVYLTKTNKIPKLHQQQEGKASEAAQSKQKTKVREDKAIPEEMNEHIYENFEDENVYENEYVNTPRRPRAPTPP
ncbi:carcinoembryonic antigen-related cell adhesion molecule 20-like isoform X1 [Labeo rohita]|uniref:carcinoembryonic antigen-related cell adhesion molecule 20-like isoform X1 n=1 Tax=Labeo rohita TaxID=84645 RepID=UPI0021E1E953|nr:carcinoembryonic antigen-related cell adhesion molecule 20-like isoform X1 [Labeo rohita]